MQATATEIRPSTVGEMEAHGSALFVEHYEEIARNKAVMVLAPDWDAYWVLESASKLLLLAAWDGSRMIGYSANYLGQHLHYRDLLYAHNDVLFVAQTHRRSRLGLQLIRETEREAKVRGAKLMLWHAKQGTTLDLMLPRMGYGVQDVIHAKEL